MTLDAAALAAAIHREATDATVVRLRPAVVAAVEAYAASAPEVVQNEAAIRLMGYWVTAPAGVYGALQIASLRMAPAEVGNMLRLSGAGALLSPHRKRRALRSKAATS